MIKHIWIIYYWVSAYYSWVPFKNALCVLYDSTFNHLNMFDDIHMRVDITHKEPQGSIST